jgi:hypothetical protein
MITIVCSSINPSDDYKNHVLKHIGLPNNKVQFLHYKNDNQFSLTQLYNIALKESINDTIIFMHDDLILETKEIGRKIEKLFQKNLDYGIIGLAGTKELSKSGRWWDNSKQMFGKVKHQHNGKTWTSSYSDDLNNNLEETLNVDGLFFAVKKSRIKINFNEEYDGFHFYDLVFCLQNYLSGVKIGVTTIVKVIHKSIGETNEKWEELRQKFVIDFENELPLKIEQTFENVKMNILIGCLSFKELTGSELYVFELAKGLKKENIDVSIISSNIGEPLLSMSKKIGLKIFDINNPPFYVKGDGKWLLPNGTPSSDNVLYMSSEPKYDLIHVNHKPITQHLLKLYPNNKFITTIHSEIISLEDPILDDRIIKYVTIRDSISEKINKVNSIPKNRIVEIANPIDEKKFNTNGISDNNEILFVGTIDNLRKDSILDLVKYSKDIGKNLRIVGKENSGFRLSDLIDLQNNPHVRYEKERTDIEKLVKSCFMVAGIKKGRTTIEGWFCGKNAIIYDVDQYGQINDRKIVKSDDINLDDYKSDIVVNKMIKTYKEIINGR